MHQPCARMGTRPGRTLEPHLLDGIALPSVQDDGRVFLIAILLDGIAPLCLDLGSVVHYILDSARGMALSPLPGHFITLLQIVWVSRHFGLVLNSGTCAE